MRTEETLIVKFGFLGMPEEAVASSSFILDTDLPDEENMTNAIIAFMDAGEAVGKELGDLFVQHLKRKYGDFE